MIEKSAKEIFIPDTCLIATRKLTSDTAKLKALKLNQSYPMSACVVRIVSVEDEKVTFEVLEDNNGVSIVLSTDKTEKDKHFFEALEKYYDNGRIGANLKVSSKIFDSWKAAKLITKPVKVTGYNRYTSYTSYEGAVKFIFKGMNFTFRYSTQYKNKTPYNTIKNPFVHNNNIETEESKEF